MLLHIENPQQFKDALNAAGEKPVCCDFWAAWCGPCRRVGPTFEALAEEYKEKATFVKVNADPCIPVLQEYGVRSIPTFIMFKKGSEVDRMTGACDKCTLENFLKNGIGSCPPT